MENTTAHLRAIHIAWTQQNAGPEYHFEVAGSRAIARAPSRRFSAELADGGLHVEAAPGSTGWSLALRWTAVGRGDATESVARPSDGPTVEGNRAHYRRPDGSEEWYLNGPLGIEHGFDLAQRPTGTGDLVVELSVAGLEPGLAPDGRSVLLRDAAQAAVLHYSDLVAQDALGNELPASLAVSGGSIRLRVDDAGARYPIYVDPLIWERTSWHLSYIPEDTDRFGSSVAISGDTFLVGDEGDASGGAVAGAAYFHERSQLLPHSWVRERKIDGASAGDYFGAAVALDGDTAVVAAAGPATTHILYRNLGGANLWGEAAVFSGAASSVAIDGDTVVIGWTQDDTAGSNAGAAHVLYRHQNGADQWGEVRKLIPGDAEAWDEFGYSVGIDGDTIVVGSPFEDTAGSDAGAAYVFGRNSGGADQWGQVRKITAADATADDEFGFSVAIDGEIAAVGAPEADGPIFDDGAGYVFYRDQGGPDQWGQVRRIIPDPSPSGSDLGQSIAVSNDMVVLGGVGLSRAYLFARDQGGADQWGQMSELRSYNSWYAGSHGWSVAIDVPTAVVGDPSYEYSFQVWSGGAAVYELLLQDGDPCSDGVECSSGHCTDGVCCSSACGGDNPDDCMACSVAEGASEDGTCSSLDGFSCDDGVFCNGTETCNGSVCTNSTGNPCPGQDVGPDCDDSCNEASDDCTLNDVDNTSCDDGAHCNGTETCSSGVCTNSTGNPCPGPDGDSDCGESCDEANDNCLGDDPDGSSCGDNVCDECSTGSCVPTSAGVQGPGCTDSTDTDCDRPDSCDGSGACLDNHESGGTACGDDVCDECSAGSCVPTAAGSQGPGCSDSTDTDCDNPDACDGSGACLDHHEGDGTACGDDVCDECSAGSCVATSAGSQGPGCTDAADTDCDNPDTCDGSGSCFLNLEANGTACGSSGDTECDDPDTCDGSGACLGNHEADGMACDDGAYCNGTETCAAGACGSSTGDPCPGPDGDDDCVESCNEAADDCTAHDPESSACEDGSFCNGTETCSSGVCGSSTGDPCEGADGDEDCSESCDEEAGDCLADDPDGVPCPDGTCAAGTCQPQGTGGAGVGGSGAGATGGSAAPGTGGELLGDDNVGQGVDQGGCGCRLEASSRRPSGWAAFGLLGLGIALLRGRRTASLAGARHGGGGRRQGARLRSKPPSPVALDRWTVAMPPAAMARIVS